MKNLALSSSLFMALFGAVACNQATAMTKAAPVIQDAPAPPQALIPVPPAENTGTFEHGVVVGLRNGGLIVERLKLRTVGTQGCDALGDLQTALLAVVRAARPPAHSDDSLVAGFYSGYLRSVRTGLREARSGCDSLSFQTGGFAGTLYGTLFCQVHAVSPAALESLEAESLYAGWTGGAESVRTECEEALAAAASECALEQIEPLAELSCSDRLPDITDGE